MNYATNSNLPGFMNMYEFSPGFASVIRPLLEKVFHEEHSSSIIPGHRAALAYWFAQEENAGEFVEELFRAVALGHLGEPEFTGLFSYSKEEPNKFDGFLAIAKIIFCNSYTNDIQALMQEAKESHGITDREIHDIVLIHSTYQMLAYYIGYSGVMEPCMTTEQYHKLAIHLVNEGYDEGTFKHLNC